MIYVVFWYLVSVTVLSTIYQFYNLTTMKADKASKLGLIIGSGTYTIKSEDVSTIGGGSYTTTNNTLLYNGGLAIGFLSSFLTHSTVDKCEE